MSFSEEVRSEIAGCMTDLDKQYACLYGILLYCRSFRQEQLLLQSESRTYADLVQTLLRGMMHMQMQPERRSSLKGSAAQLYTIEIRAQEQITALCRKFHIDPAQRTVELQNITRGSTGALLAGIFFACGSVMNPDREYHLEFNTPTRQLCADLGELLMQTLGFSGAVLHRRSGSVLYLQDSEQIEDLLVCMGAQQCVLDLMNIKIRKDMRNRANRLRNCDEANINKAVTAALRQLQDIERILVAGRFDSLPPELRAAAELRIEHPDMSLKEIGELLNPPLGRSGVNRRFQKIARIAEEISHGAE